MPMDTRENVTEFPATVTAPVTDAMPTPIEPSAETPETPKEATNSLQAFLAGRINKGKTAYVYPSQDYMDRDFAFKIKSLSSASIDELRTRHGKELAKGKSDRFNMDVFLLGVVEPDFGDADLIRSRNETEKRLSQESGTPYTAITNAAQCARAILNAGEIDTVVGEIQRLSGYDPTFEALRKEARDF